MKKLFYFGILALICFEIASVWLIMPMPYSQRIDSIDVAYALYRWRWVVRAAIAAMIAVALIPVWRAGRRHRVAAPLLLVAAGLVAYATNFVMTADRIFLAPVALNMQPAESSAVDRTRLVVGVEVNGEARAYPIQFLGYHHQVRDVVGGAPVLVTYCTVCRTGRVFDPTVDGRVESFRLVGMDHYNAMFEDRTTRTWWRQANGEAIVGPRTGMALGDIPSRQVTLAVWLAMHPHSLIMQADSALGHRYPKTADFETGLSRSALTGTDTLSWSEKAWVVGVTIGTDSKAYDWNRLRRERVINDEVGSTPIVLALAADDASFFAFQRPAATMRFELRADSLVTADAAYDRTGRGAQGTLVPLPASQEFWHSWRTFQPATKTY
jgi:hypothetical protein